MITLTDDGTTPIQVAQGSEIAFALSGTFDGATVSIGYATAPPVAASLDVDDADESPAFSLFANDGGTQGNDYTLALTAAAASNPSLSVVQSGLDFVIQLATDDGDAAELTTAMTGEDNDVTITADTDGVIGNGYSIELLAGSGATQALKVSTVDYLKFTVLLERDSDAIVTTGAELVAALNAYAPFAALMTAANAADNNGTGVVTALAEADLTGGGANFAITSTAADVVNFINSELIFRPHFSAELATDYDGEGLAVAVSEDSFTGGTFGTFTNVIGTFPDADALSFTAAGAAIVKNVGVSNWMQLTVASADESTSVNVTTNSHRE
jgi:hypothetical protein